MTSRPVWYPSRNACTGSAPDRSAAPRRVLSTAPITVMPSSPATSREALSSAEAMPARTAGRGLP